MALLYRYKPNELCITGVKLFCTNFKHVFVRHRILLWIRCKPTVRLSGEAIRYKTSDVPSCTQVIEKPVNMKGTVAIGSKMTLREIEILVKYFLSTENSEVISLVLLRCCTNYIPFLNAQYKIELSEQILKMWSKRGRKLARHHFEALLRCYIENGHTIDLPKFLFELECSCITPYPKIYNMLLKCFCAKGQMDDAMKVINMMHNNNISLDESHYSELILGWGLLTNFYKVNEIIKEMKKLEVPIGNLMHMSFLKIFSAYGDLALLKILLNIIQMKQIEFSDKQIMEIIENLTIHQHYSIIPYVLDQINNYQIKEMKEVVVKLVFNKQINNAVNLIKLAKDKQLPIIEMSPYFIRELISNKLPLNDLIKFGSALVKKGIDDYALHEIFYCLSSQGATEDCMKVSKTMMNMGIQLRIQYFWPLLLKEFDRCGEKGMLQILSEMKDLNISFNFQTLIFIILPKIKIKSSSCTVLKLSDVTGWKRKDIRFSLAFFYLKKGDIEEGVDIVRTHPKVLLYCTKGKWLQRLGKAIMRSPNTNGLTDFLEFLKPSLVDDLLLVLICRESDDLLDCSKLIKVVQILNTHQYKISENVYKTWMKVAPESLRTPFVQKLLKEMIESEIISSDKRHNQLAFFRNFEAFKTLSLVSDNNDPVALLQKLFFHYVYTGSWEKAYGITCQLIEKGVDMSSVTRRQLILSVCIMNKDLMNSKKYYSSLMSSYPEHQMRMNQVFYYCALLAEKGLHEESLRIIKKGQFSSMDLKENVKKSVLYLMEAVATHHSVKIIEDYIRELKSYVALNNYMLSPCVRLFVQSENLQDAVEMFEKFCSELNACPYIIGLMNLALRKNDDRALERIRKASGSLLGKKTTVILEMMAISELGDSEKLQQVFRLYGLFPFSIHLQQAVIDKSFLKQYRRFVDEGRIDGLLNFYYALEKFKKGFLILDHILDCYDRRADYKGAEEFMQQLDSKNVEVPLSFRIRMNEFLFSKKDVVSFSPYPAQNSVS